MRERIPRGGSKQSMRLVVRIPRSLHEYIAESAKFYNRSVNYETFLRLASSVWLDRILDKKTARPEEIAADLDKLRTRLREMRLVEFDD